MAIRNLKPATVTQFLGKNTAQNLSDAAVGTMLSAFDVMVLGDNQVRRAPGYTLVKSALGVGEVYAIYDFQRTVDSAQFVIVHVGSQIFAMQADGSGVTLLVSGQTSTPFMFVENAFICYASNGVEAYRFVDNAGTLTAYAWGIDAPSSAPSIALFAGTLTLTYGRRYVYCGVSKYTDSLGIERVSIGPPSPFSAHTGPVLNGVVTLSGMSVSVDPQVNFKWIFATSDSPLNTSATFYFAAEIPNSQTSWGDTLPDSALDVTRLAPFDNNPAPPSEILTTFQNRVVGIQQNQIRLSGYEEITLGIPEESWPLDLFFNIPAGDRMATAAIALQQGTVLAVCTSEYWYGYTGYDASTFTEQDRIASPGAVGRFAVCLTPFGVCWLSESKRLWIWKGTGDPTEISSDISIQAAQTYAMPDLSTADLSTVRIHWYSFGQLHFLAVFARTSDAVSDGLNLIQLWSVSIKGSQSSGEYTGTSSFFTQIGGLYETDKFPAVNFTASGDVHVGYQPYIFTGDVNGNVYRFPDGFQNLTAATTPKFSIPWTLCGVEGKKRMYWVDLFVEASDAADTLTKFKLYAATAESPDQGGGTPIELEMQLVPSPDGTSQYAIRGNMQALGTNVGRYVKVWVELPGDTNDDQVLLKMIIWYAPLYVGVP